MSFAIVKTGGKQFSVEAGQVVRVPTIDAEAGSKVTIPALVAGAGSDIKIGDGSVEATVVGHGRGEKVIVFKKKRRKGYAKKNGHRQQFTKVQIENIG